MLSRAHCSANLGKHTKEKNPSAVKSASKLRHRETEADDDEVLDSCGGEVVLETNFLFLDCFFPKASSFLGSFALWIHSL